MKAEKTEQIETNIYAAMINVMIEVKNIDKSLTVGDGKSSYKGVADKDVKQVIGQSMAKNGLVCFPISIDPKVTIERWNETQNYNGQQYEKVKQSVFTEVLAKFKIVHALTGDSIDIVGYGHGIDTQDKSAGKATTYALKNALLYSFLVPTGAIDDTDKTHSNDIEAPQISSKIPLNDNQFIRAIKAVQNNEITKDELINDYQLTNTQLNTLNNLA
jgi:hypothetical protein